VETGEKINEETIQFIEVIKHNHWVDGLGNFCTDHPFVEWYKQRRRSEFAAFFKKDRFMFL